MADSDFAVDAAAATAATACCTVIKAAAAAVAENKASCGKGFNVRYTGDGARRHWAEKSETVENGA